MVQQRQLVANGVRYHIYEQGEGTPLVLLHGFTSSGRSWLPHMEHFARSFRVIAIDLIGHGQTDRPSDLSFYTMAAIVEQLRSVFQQLQLDSFHLLGYSMGGRVAAQYALTYDHCLSLTLVSSTLGLVSEAERQARRASDEQLAQLIEQRGMAAFVSYWESIPLFASQKRLPSEAQERIRQSRLQQSPIGLANSLRGYGTGSQPSLWVAIEAWQKPLFLLVGSLDEKFVHLAEQIEKRCRHAKKIIFHDAGHAIHVEQPKIFVKMVMELLHKEDTYNGY